MLLLEIFCQQHPNQRMTPHDQYLRGIKEPGEKIFIYRLICPICRGTIAVLPDFLLPYKQYSANEIEAVLMDAETTNIYDIETKASVYTVRRWIKTMRPQVTAWVSMLKTRAVELTGKAVSEVRLAGLGLISQLQCLSEHLPKIRCCGNMLGFAGIYLSNYSMFRFCT